MRKTIVIHITTLLVHLLSSPADAKARHAASEVRDLAAGQRQLVKWHSALLAHNKTTLLDAGIDIKLAEMTEEPLITEFNSMSAWLEGWEEMLKSLSRATNLMHIFVVMKCANAYLQRMYDYLDEEESSDASDKAVELDVERVAEGQQRLAYRLYGEIDPLFELVLVERLERLPIDVEFRQSAPFYSLVMKDSDVYRLGFYRIWSETSDHNTPTPNSDVSTLSVSNFHITNWPLPGRPLFNYVNEQILFQRAQNFIICAMRNVLSHGKVEVEDYVDLLSYIHFLRQQYRFHLLNPRRTKICLDLRNRTDLWTLDLATRAINWRLGEVFEAGRAHLKEFLAENPLVELGEERFPVFMIFNKGRSVQLQMLGQTRCHNEQCTQ